jgi:hypothetical protein
MPRSTKSRTLKKARVDAFQEFLNSPEAAKWSSITAHSKYHYTLLYSKFEGNPVQVYPSTLKVVDIDLESFLFDGIKSLIAGAKHHSLTKFTGRS